MKSAKVRRRARRNCGGRCCSATSAGPPIPACAWWLSPPHPENLPALEAWCTRNELAVCHPSFDVAGIGAGFSLPAEQLLLITEKELITAGFSREGRTAEGEVPAPVSADPAAVPVPEFSLADLDEGDYAVHIDHGIGIFRGFRTLTSRGVSREVLVIEYADNQILYVPLLQAHKVSRYLGSPGKVTLHRLGGVRWSRDKESARRSVRSYAADMLRLQAMRQAAPGIVFPPDTAETRAFLRAFPFNDTPDQRRSTAEIRADMESPRPMDRLLCGDVGYGKTELAMRAAFKAVSAGYQVAILAPTTVLAQQHYYSFRERFAAYPYTIDVLSRFRSASEQNEIIRRLGNGGIDIIIGTHRLCNPELKFHNLGLVVIDEEQRFGVKHKERLRRFRAEVDVLTMSATPIPRTLYLAMAGARDLSTLMTAPKLRLPVKTVIAPEEDRLVVQAIEAELARGGQVYYLHNRVRTIEEVAKKLRSLLPDVRFAVAHGQMPEEELEAVMTSFLEGRSTALSAVPSSNPVSTCRTPTPSSLNGPTGSGWPNSISSAAGSAAGSTRPTPTCCCRRASWSPPTRASGSRRSAAVPISGRDSSWRCAIWRSAARGTCSARSSRATSTRSDSTSTATCSSRRSASCAAKRANSCRRWRWRSTSSVSR
ncbi:MAG: DEAD/DEAH box helicase [Lentisphaeria bacterium]|nr:MAG: DEAD/DEAH box helicase [Lentisphaeria bacterium]